MSSDLVVYVHTNLLSYMQALGPGHREEWLKGKTKMWDVFPDDMGLDNSIELAMSSFMLVS
jgi:hypothetical protein